MHTQCAHPYHAIERTTGPGRGKCHKCGAEVAKGPTGGWSAVPQDKPCIHDCSQIEVISADMATCLGCHKLLTRGPDGGWIEAMPPFPHPVEPAREKTRMEQIMDENDREIENRRNMTAKYMAARQYLRDAQIRMRSLRDELKMAYAKIEGFEMAFALVQSRLPDPPPMCLEHTVEHAIDKFLAEP